MVLSQVRRSVIEDMRIRLLAPFSREELHAALKALAKGSCPGVDGLAPAFYLRHWDTVAPGLCLAFQKVMRTGVMPDTFAEGLF